MRLICPNCDAQYDIADDVIPEGGRDVQCSNCQHTWFQTDKPKVAGRSRPILTPSTAAPARTKDEADDAATSTLPAARKPLDRSIADILREEAARDHDVPPVTAAEPDSPATESTEQDTAAERAAETRRRISRLTGEADAPTPEAMAVSGGSATAGKLRTVPGIDEINATLRSRAEASDTSGLTETEKKQAVQRRGFRRGFSIVLVLIGLAIAPYFFAQDIVERFPQTRDFMTQYVGTVDQLRLQLREAAGQVEQMVENLMPSQTDTLVEGDAPADAPPEEQPAE